LARAKSTQRAEARRRYRAAQAAARASETAETADAAPDEDAAPTTAPSSRPAFRVPDVIGDLRALPGLFRARPLLFAPIALMLLAFALVFVPLPTDATIRFVVQFYISSFLYPVAILAMFLGGILAPRASYLVGLLIGLINGLLMVALIAIGAASSEVLPPGQFASGALQLLIIPTLYGLAIGAFASWYRDFLRRSAERRRANVEARARERRREARRGARAVR
jgi:hypothetical protein